jgi:hypothetical protein
MMEFKVPFNEIPQKLVVKNFATEIILPKINPESPYVSDVPGPVGKTIPYGETHTVDDIFQVKVTAPKLIKREGSDNMIAVIDVVTSTSDQSNFSYEVLPQLTLEDGVLWDQPYPGTGFYIACGENITLDFMNGEMFNSDLKIVSGKETHNWYCYATHLSGNIDKTQANFTIPIGYQFLTFSGKPE